MKHEHIYSRKDTRIFKSEPVVLPQSQTPKEYVKVLNQPNAILDAHYNYRLIQLSALVKVTNILQPIINKNIDEYVALRRHYGKNAPMPSQDYLLANGNVLRMEMQNVVWKIDERTVEVKLPLNAFTTTPSRYGYIQEAIMDLTKIAVKYPEYSDLAKKVLTDGQRSLCTGVFFSKDGSQKNRIYVHLFFREEIARLLVNPCYGYSRLQQVTIDNCRSVYTARIYMQICRHADGKKWAIPYRELRILLNIDLPAKKDTPMPKHRYHEFRRRILDTTRDELLGLAQNNTTNYYFTYTEEFTSTRHNTPSFIIFNIYETSPSNKDITNFEKILKQMRHFALDILHIGQDRCNRVFKDIGLRNYTYVYQRHIIAWEYMMDHESIIQKKDAYYLKSIENAIKEEKISHDQGTIQLTMF